MVCAQAAHVGRLNVRAHRRNRLGAERQAEYAGASVASVLDCYRVLGDLELQLATQH